MIEINSEGVIKNSFSVGKTLVEVCDNLNSKNSKKIYVNVVNFNQVKAVEEYKVTKMLIFKEIINDEKDIVYLRAYDSNGNTFSNCSNLYFVLKNENKWSFLRSEKYFFIKNSKYDR